MSVTWHEAVSNPVATTVYFTGGYNKDPELFYQDKIWGIDALQWPDQPQTGQESCAVVNDAVEGQKTVEVSEPKIFQVGMKVKIADNNASELNWVVNVTIFDPSDPFSTGVLTMQNNLVNTYKVAEDAYVIDVSDWKGTWLKDENGIPWGIELYGHEVCGGGGNALLCQGEHLTWARLGRCSPYIFPRVTLGDPSQHRINLRWYLDYIYVQALLGWYNTALWVYLFPKNVEEGATFTFVDPKTKDVYPNLNTIEFQIQVAYYWAFAFRPWKVTYDPLYGGILTWRPIKIANETVQGWHEYDFSLGDVISGLEHSIDISFNDLVISIIEFGFEGKWMEEQCKVDRLYWYSP